MKRLDFDTLVKCINWCKQEFYMGELTKTIMSGSPNEFLLIPDEDYDEAMQALEARRREEEKLMKTSKLNNEGIAFEKGGQIDEAIRVYEENISIGYPASHSFERLMILYRKRKEYENEMRVIRRAIEVFSSTRMTDLLVKYNDRLKKVEVLLNHTPQ